MPFLLAEILDFQGSAHLIGVGSLSELYFKSGTLPEYEGNGNSEKSDIVNIG